MLIYPGSIWRTPGEVCLRVMRSEWDGGAKRDQTLNVFLCVWAGVFFGE